MFGYASLLRDPYMCRHIENLILLLVTIIFKAFSGWRSIPQTYNQYSCKANNNFKTNIYKLKIFHIDHVHAPPRQAGDFEDSRLHKNNNSISHSVSYHHHLNLSKKLQVANNKKSELFSPEHDAQQTYQEEPKNATIIHNRPLKT